MGRDWRKSAVLIGGLALVAAAVAYYVRSRAKASDGGDSGPDSDEKDRVDLYIDESFPASDAPGYTPETSIGGSR